MMVTVTVVAVAVELSVEWLWEIREKLLAHEYLVLLATVRYLVISSKVFFFCHFSHPCLQSMSREYLSLRSFVVAAVRVGGGVGQSRPVLSSVSFMCGPRSA